MRALLTVKVPALRCARWGARCAVRPTQSLAIVVPETGPPRPTRLVILALSWSPSLASAFSRDRGHDGAFGKASCLCPRPATPTALGVHRQAG